MQTSTPSNPIKEENIDGKSKASPCHASTAPAKTKHPESSHGCTTPGLVVKKPTSLLLKENGVVKPKQVIKILVKPKIPACIKACDVSSLLDQFLEYEQNQSTSITIVKGSSITLTPMSSPSHKNKPNFTGLVSGGKKAATPTLNGLTPPVSPPLQSPVENLSTICKTTLVTKATVTLPSPGKTVTPSKMTSKNIHPNVDTTKRNALKRDETKQDKNSMIDDTNSNGVSAKDETKLEDKTESKEVTGCSSPQKPIQSKSTSPTASRLQNASSRSSCMRKTVDVHKSLDIKRHFSSDDDDDDKNEYNDFKRKKYNKDECYWTTSGDDSDDNRGKRNYRNERKNESSNYSKRRHSRDYSSDSDDDRRQRRKHNHCKYQRRSERSPHRSRSPHRGNSSNSEDETHRRRRRHRHHRTHDKKSSPHKESSKESNVHLYDIENERKKNFKLDRTIKETSTEKRKIVYIGNIDKTMTKSDVWTIFRKFGPIEKTTVHYRDDGDSYSFVTFVDPSSALEAIEEGKSDPKLKHLDICFGGRRRYCGGSYVDFDSTTSCLEEQQEKEGRRKSSHSNEAMDFDALLQMCLKKNK